MQRQPLSTTMLSLAALQCSLVLTGSRAASTSQRAATSMLTQDELKKMVGYKAVDDYVKSGMKIGLGTGSTAAFAVERVGELLKSGALKDIVAIPTSVATQKQAEGLGIPLATLDSYSELDVAIDGADEVDPDLNLVKGGGGALLREKMVEVCAKKFIVIVDESKLCAAGGRATAHRASLSHRARTAYAATPCRGQVRRPGPGLPAARRDRAVLLGAHDAHRE